MRASGGPASTICVVGEGLGPTARRAAPEGSEMNDHAFLGVSIIAAFVVVLLSLHMVESLERAFAPRRGLEWRGVTLAAASPAEGDDGATLISRNGSQL